jgi:4-amino-4-deoxy-L-arabinose transferase-like glycosyltransferase
MVALAILGGALGAGFLVLVVGRLLSSSVPAAFAAALYIFNPLLWFYGELPLIYALEGGITVVLAWAALRMEEGRGPFLTACALFALAGGLRQSTLVLLSPLFLYGLWKTWRRGRLTFGLFLGGAALGTVLVLAWLVPLCLAAGGYGAYRQISSEHFKVLLPQTSILYGAGAGALRHNLEVLTKWALQGLVPGAAALAVLWIATPKEIVPGLRLLASRLAFLLPWAVPPMLFFALFHITKAGYTLVHLPALLTILTVAAAPALSADRLRAIGATALAVLLGAGLFLFGTSRASGPSSATSSTAARSRSTSAPWTPPSPSSGAIRRATPSSPPSSCRGPAPPGPKAFSTPTTATSSGTCQSIRSSSSSLRSDSPR